MEKRIVGLDGLRGCAAILVVLYHYLSRYDSIYGHVDLFDTSLFRYGNQGVQLFFMISGFVIFMTINKIKKPFDFIVSRFFRLYPTYWMSVFITYTVIYFFGLEGRETSLQTAIKNLLMFHQYLGVPNVDGVYWTLRVELTFYFWIFLAYILKQLKRIEYFMLLFLTVNILDEFQIIQVPSLIQKVFIFKYLPFFNIGICMYKYYMRENNRLTNITFLISLLLTIIFFSWISFVVYVVFTIIFFLIIKKRLPILNSKFLVSTGVLSYALYLLHQNIGYVIINKGYDLDINPLLSILAAILSMFCLSYLVTKFIEKPINKLAKTYLRN